MTELKFKSEMKKTGKRSGVHRQVMDGLETPVNRQVYMVWYAYAQYLKKNGLVIKREKRKKNFEEHKTGYTTNGNIHLPGGMLSERRIHKSNRGDCLRSMPI